MGPERLMSERVKGIKDQWHVRYTGQLRSRGKETMNVTHACREF